MKIYLLSVLYFTFFVSSAFANICGLLELEDGSLLEVNQGNVYDLNGQFLANAVPVTKKVQITNELGTGTIQVSKANNKKTRKSKKQIKIQFDLNSGQKLTAVVNQAGSLVFFDSVASNFVLIDLNKSTVARAYFTESSNKLKFINNDSEFFSLDSCKNF